MSVPARIVLERSYNRVFVAFSEDIARVSAVPPWSDGFTLTANSAPVVLGGVTKVSNGLWLSPSVDFDDSDVVTVAYAGTNLVDAATGLSAVATFSATFAPLSSAVLPSIVCAIIPAATPDTIVVTFRDPVASEGGDFLADLTLRVNGVIVSLAGAAATGSGRTLTIETTADFAYNAEVSLSYTPGDWVYPTADTGVPAFTATATNASVIGTQVSGYPLSTVLVEPLSITGNAVLAQLTVYLNSVDRDLVTRYAPSFDQGGYFGAPTVNPPDGYFVPGKLMAVRDGQVYSYTFTVANNTLWASLAATEWLTTMSQRIGVALNTARATDQTIAFGTTTKVAV
jgi:hypothetical protein